MTENTATTRCCDEYDSYLRRQWDRRVNRRNFIKTTVGVVGGATVLPHLLFDSAFADQLHQGTSTDPILVVIQLAGGNDGLNTIVPYASGLYYQDRPNIAVPAKSVLPIDSTVGFNPNLQPLKQIYDEGNLAILQGVGYPSPDLSHFRSTAIWESADPVGFTSTGWLGRYLDTALAGDSNPMKAVALGSMVPQTLVSAGSPVVSIQTVQTFRFLLNRQEADPIMNAYRTMYEDSGEHVSPYIGLVRKVEQDADQGAQDLQSVSTKYTPSVKYPVNPLARDLQLTSQIIAAGLGTRVFHLSLNGFDDHAAEVYTHANLLKMLADSVSAFYQDLKGQGKADQVMIMTFSEFGRRVKENAGRGTDHGTSAPLFVLGGKVKGGMFGSDPILSNLDNDGDLIYGIDFRSVYGTVLDGWLGADSNKVLGGSFERLPFV